MLLRSIYANMFDYGAFNGPDRFILLLSVGAYPERLDRERSKLPYLGGLVQDHQDIKELRGHPYAT